MTAGRPTKYDPAFCEVARTFMVDGYSVTALAGHLGVARSSLFKWAGEHEEFSDALKSGQASAALFWEKTLKQVATTGEGNASAAIFGVKNRSSEDWKDKHETEHSGTIQFSDMTEEDLDRRIEALKNAES